MSSLDINRLLKPVAFSTEKPKLWFEQIEAQFWTYTITDDFMKYNYVITQLDRESMIQVEDIMQSPPNANKYDTLKSALIDRLAKLKIKKMKNILYTQDCGTDKPSEYLKRLRELAGQDLDELSVKEAWVNGLSCKMLWAISSELFSSSVDRLAEIADAAHSTLPATSHPDITLKLSTDQETSDLMVDEMAKDISEFINFDHKPKSGHSKTRRSKNHKQKPAGHH